MSCDSGMLEILFTLARVYAGGGRGVQEVYQ